MPALPPAALFLVDPPRHGGAGVGEVALIRDWLDGHFIATPLDATAPRVYAVTPQLQFFFPTWDVALRVLGPTRETWLIGASPAALGLDGALRARSALPAVQATLRQLLTDAGDSDRADSDRGDPDRGDAALPPRVLQRLQPPALPEPDAPPVDPRQAPLFGDLPDFGTDEPPRRG